MTAAQTSAPEHPLFGRRNLVNLVLPMLLEQVLSVTMGMADTLMVSGVGEAAVSSVSLVDSINILIIQILAALATGGAVIGSQYLGRRDAENARRSAAQLYTVLAVSTVAVMVLSLAFCRPILRGVFGQIDDDVMRYAQQYFIVSAISYPFIGAYNAGAALFRAQGNSRISMLASLVMNVINICGNALLIYGFGMGVLGAALATLVGRIFAAVWVFRQQQQFENPLRIGSLAEMRPEKEMILRILNIGIGDHPRQYDEFGDDPGRGAVPGGRGEKAGQALRPAAVGRSRGRDGRDQHHAVFDRAAHVQAVQPFGRVHRHVRAGAALVRCAQHLFLVHQLYAAQRPARGRRRQIHNDRQHHQHVAVPRAAVLLFRRPLGLWPAGRVDGHVH